MNKSELAEAVAQRAALPKTRALEYVNTVFAVMSDELVNGGKVVISDFGTMMVMNRTGFHGHNPRTGEPYEVPPRSVAYFRCGKGLKARLNP